MGSACSCLESFGTEQTHGLGEGCAAGTMQDAHLQQRLLLSLCRSDHNDKLSVHAELVNLFNAFQAGAYRTLVDPPLSE